MRSGAVCFVTLLAALGAADDDTGGATADDTGDDAGDASTSPPVKDFDLDLPEDDRKKMMTSCYLHSINRLSLRQDEIQKSVAELPGQKKQETLNTILFSWTLGCYMSIKGDALTKVTLQDTKEMEESIFDQPPAHQQQPNQASPRQWQLLESVMMEMKLEEDGWKKQNPKGAGAGAHPMPSVALTGKSQTMYVLIVFGVFFGLGAIAVLKLVRAGGQVQSEKDAKKAEKLARKRR